MKYATTINDKTYIIEVNDDKKVVVDGVEYAVDFESVSGQPVYSLLINGRSYEAYIHEGEENDAWQVLIRGDLFSVSVVLTTLVAARRSRGKARMAWALFALVMCPV